MLTFEDRMFIHVLFVRRRVWRYERGNQNPYIEEQTTQWPKEKSVYGRRTDNTPWPKEKVQKKSCILIKLWFISARS